MEGQMASLTVQLLAQHEQLQKLATALNGVLASSSSALQLLPTGTGSSQSALGNPWGERNTAFHSRSSSVSMSDHHKSTSQLLLDLQLRERRRSSNCSQQSMAVGSLGGDIGTVEPEEIMHRAKRRAIFRLHARLGKESFAGTVSAARLHAAVVALGLTKYERCEIEEWLAALDTAKENRRSVSPQRYMCWRRRSSEGARLATMAFGPFVDALLNEGLLQRLDLTNRQMTLTIREVLLSGEANRLVSELTHVHVDDVAAPLERQDVVTKLEPVFAWAVLLNGLAIGLQTMDAATMAGEGEAGAWFWCNVLFTLFFLAEVLTRLRQEGARRYLCGMERSWNLFDLLLLLVSVCDVAMSASPAAADLTAFGVLRVARLLRVTRLFRLFRLKYFRELNLMVSALVRGVQTLFSAVVVLFFTLFVIAVTATRTMGDLEAQLTDSAPPLLKEVMREQLFASLPRSFFTCFRCFMGDCTTSRGHALVPILMQAYGASFVLAYMASTVFVVFGVFNLVAAVYVENTLNAAKSDGEKSKAERHRESVRIARLTRQLLKMFCAAQKLDDEPDTPEVQMALRSSALDDMGDANLSISKEAYLCIIQDPGVQSVMDELEIPPDRAGLFDVLDSEGGGLLQVQELITGLLQVRGEARKRDILGAVVAARACQGLLRGQDLRMARLECLAEDLMSAVQEGQQITAQQLQQRRQYPQRADTSTTLRSGATSFQRGTMSFLRELTPPSEVKQSL